MITHKLLFQRKQRRDQFKRATKNRRLPPNEIIAAAIRCGIEPHKANRLYSKRENKSILSVVKERTTDDLCTNEDSNMTIMKSVAASNNDFGGISANLGNDYMSLMNFFRQ